MRARVPAANQLKRPSALCCFFCFRLEPSIRIELMTSPLPRGCSTTELAGPNSNSQWLRSDTRTSHSAACVTRRRPSAPACGAESGRRDSNPRRSAWKADALPTELLPRPSPPLPLRAVSSTILLLGAASGPPGLLLLLGAASGPPGLLLLGAASGPPALPWRVMDSNHRRHSRQIYSLLPLATRATLRNYSCLPL